VNGKLSVDELLVIATPEGETTGTYPEDVYVEHLHTYTYSVNETGEITFSVADKSFRWVYPHEPPTRVYIPELNSYLYLDYGVDLSVTTGGVTQSSGNTTYSQAGIVVSLVVKTYIRFDKMPSKVGSVDIGSLIMKYAFNGVNPIIHYEVLAKKYVDGVYAGDIYISEDVTLSFENLVINLYTISFDIDSVVRSDYVLQGDLDRGAVVKPRYNAIVCGNVIGGDRVFEAVVSIGTSETTLRIDGDPEKDCGTLENIELLPGRDTNIVALIRTGAFTVTANLTKDIEGALISIGKPSGRAIGTSGSWEFVVTVPIHVSGYYSSWPRFKVEGNVESQLGSIPCDPITISSPGSYTLVCNTTLYFGASINEILSAKYIAKVVIYDEFDNPHEVSGTVSMSAMDPSDIADVAWKAYSYAVRVILGGMVFVLALMVLSILKEFLTGYPLVDPVYLRGVLLTLVVSLLIIYVALPVVYSAFTTMLSSMPVFQKYVEPPAASDPETVFKHLIGYYEKLFQAIERDYQVRFIGGINEIMNSLQLILAIAFGALLVALALSTPFTPGGGIPFASVGGAILTIVFTYLGLLMMTAPGGAMVLAAVAIGRVIILMTVAVIISIMTLGVFLLSIPSPLSQRLGEDFFGSGVLFFIAFPMIGPVTYTLYSHVIDTATSAIQGTIDVSLLGFQILIPIGPIAQIMIYFTATGAAVLIIMMSLSYILSRTGIAVGIGEALSGLVWRG
jgi:hypothetical protein